MLASPLVDRRHHPLVRPPAFFDLEMGDQLADQLGPLGALDPGVQRVEDPRADGLVALDPHQRHEAVLGDLGDARIDLLRVGPSGETAQHLLDRVREQGRHRLGGIGRRGARQRRNEWQRPVLTQGGQRLDAAHGLSDRSQVDLFRLEVFVLERRRLHARLTSPFAQERIHQQILGLTAGTRLAP